MTDRTISAPPHDRGNITLAMLFGHEGPLEDRGGGRREYHYPPELGRGERRALRLDYIVEHLAREDGATCAQVAAEFGIISENAYKDLMTLRAEGRVRVVPKTKPTVWEASQ